MTIICSVLLVIIVLIQKGKGGGLTAGLGVGNQMMGVKKTTDFLEKATWVLISAIVVFCLMSSYFIGMNKPDANDIDKQETEQRSEKPESSEESTVPISTDKE